jgi:uncharacterized membrane protein YphA (DoxX/SURF4 family)
MLPPIIPPVVVYVGLAACLVALFVASVGKPHPARVFFLLALRLAIGWHFLFEGLHKIHSHYVGPTDWNRPFSSEPYFVTADGPLGPLVRAQIGDPETLIKTRIVPAVAIDTDKGNSGEYYKAVPKPVADEWQAYVAKFKDEILKDVPDAALTIKAVELPILENYARWILGVDKGKESKVRYVQTDVGFTVPQRLAHIGVLEKQVKDLKDRTQPGLGQGYGYDQTRMTAAKNELRQARADLLADADAVIADMKKELFTKTAGKRIADFKPPSVQLADESSFKELLAFTPPGGPATFETSIPPLVKGIFTNYLETVRAVYPLKADGQKVIDAADYWKQSLADWSAKGGMKKAKDDYDAAVKGGKKDDIDLAKAAVLAELDKHFATYKSGLGNMIPPEVASGVIATPAVKPVTQMDLFTRYFIAAVGAGIFFGLFTRLSSVLAAGFLVMTYLTHPPFPWLPLPPNTEGNPLFINKNVIEALALLVIAVHPTGLWLGLDALLHKVIFGTKNRDLV